eukprot:COSAG02_NODE_3946_length_5997_cov_6.308579_3_plen_108_part_00
MKTRVSGVSATAFLHPWDKAPRFLDPRHILVFICGRWLCFHTYICSDEYEIIITPLRHLASTLQDTVGEGSVGAAVLVFLPLRGGGGRTCVSQRELVPRGGGGVGVG